MSPRIARIAALVAGTALAAIAPAGPSTAQQANTETVYARARSVAADATTLLQTVGLEAAEPLLLSALDACPPAADGTDCRRVIQYALGFAYQSEARKRADDRDAMLRQASERFRRVLEENPDYEPARRGLALSYRQMGAHEWQEPDLRALAETDETGRYAMVLGDYYRDHQRWGDALEAYRRAGDLAPDGEEPRLRILGLFRSPEAPIRPLAPLLTEWQVLFPALAADGYRLYMQRVYAEDPSEAAGVLAPWLFARERIDGIGPELVDQVPEDWGALPFASLRTFLLEPGRAAVPEWWSGSPARAEAIAAVALALGRWKIADPDSAASAERIWRRGLELAPRYSATWLDLTTELAVLYDRVPALDPDGARFAGLEKQLFRGKGDAIGARNYEAMERFHGTLGLIYSRREEWGSSGNVRSAIFQLEHALDAARERQGETGIHQPLPELRRHLAEAYGATGDTAAAGAAYEAAALAYLEVDDLGAARQALDAAGRREPGTSRLGRAVEAWLDLRGRAAARRPCDAATLDEIRAAPAEGLDSDALARQRFKALSDCASTTARYGPELAAAALDVVLDGRVSLVGVGDLARLEDSRRHVFRSFGQTVGAAPVAPTATGPTDGVVPIALPEEGGGLYVTAGADARIAAAIVRELRPSDGAAGDVRLEVRSGRVLVLDPGSASSATLVERLRPIEGVREVGVRRR